MSERLKLYKITQNEIIKTKIITPKDISLVIDEDTRTLYVYKGKYSPTLDEFQSKQLYERIINRFLNPNILLLQTLEGKREDSEEVISVKRKIINHYPNLIQYELKRKIRNVVLFEAIREKIQQFKTYENSRDWRRKLSNHTNIWRLSIFNVITIILAIVFIFFKLIINFNQDSYNFIESDGTVDTVFWNLWRENNTIILSVIGVILCVTLIVNLAFYLFPMKFPISPKSLPILEGKTLAKYQKSSDTMVPKPDLKTPVLPPTKAELKAMEEAKVDKKQIKGKKGKLDIAVKQQVPAIKPSAIAVGDINDTIPSVPTRKAISIDVTEEELEDLAKRDTDKIKYIIIDCKMCGKNISMPIQRDWVENAKEPVVEVSFVHGVPIHNIVAQVDHDYAVRRRRVSHVMMEDK